MASPDEYKAVEEALLKMIVADENSPALVNFHWMIPTDLAPHLAIAGAQVAVDTLDAYRAKEKK